MRIEMLEPYGRGGIHYYAQSLAEGISDLGHEVEVVTARSAESPEWNHGVHYAKRLEAFTRQVNWPTVPRRARSAALQLVNYYIGRSMMSIASHDVAHFVCPPMLWADRCVAEVAKRRPTVVTVHNVLPHDSNPQSVLSYWKRIYEAAHVLVCHTEATVRDLETLFGLAVADRAVIIPLPVDDGSWPSPSGFDRRSSRLVLDLPEEAFVLLFFGALRPYKGLDTLLDALPLLVESAPEARLVVAGMCDDWEEYRLQIDRLGVGASVIERIGWVDREHIPLYLTAADVAVLPYKHIDGSAVAAVSAFMGLPMIMSDIPGFRAVWGPDEVMYVAGGADEWSEALLAARNGITLAQSRAQRARSRALREMSWSASASAHLDAYRLAIARFEVADR